MLTSAYLAGLAAEPFGGAPGVFAVADARRRSSYRYLSSYRDGKAQKARIFGLLARSGRPERPAEWDLHHVVEGQHFADVDFDGTLASSYADALPCVLIHNVEHRAYNRLLHCRETDELFRDVLPRDVAARSRAAAAAYRAARGAPEGLGRLRARVRELQALYLGAYDGDPVLRRVAANVFDVALRKLH